MTNRLPYPSNISDARWALIGPPLLAWQQARIDRRPTGEPARTDVREVFNALLYLNRTGCAWKYLPMTSRRTARCITTTPLGATRASSPSSTSS
jgi:transposase